MGNHRELLDASRAEHVEAYQGLGCTVREAVSIVDLVDVVRSTLERRLPQSVELLELGLLLGRSRADREQPPAGPRERQSSPQARSHNGEVHA